MKAAFKSIKMGKDRLAMIETVNAIVREYNAEGLRLTLRQLYYQLVSRDLIPNTERSYKNTISLVGDGRLCGLIDWEAIEDRVRVPREPSEFKSLEALIDTAIDIFRLPRWEGQENYVELWVEKDALSGVLSPLATEAHITLMVNKGYSSLSAMYEAAQRFGDQIVTGHEPYLLYLGDHDPSGEDMVRDIRDRLAMFGSEVEVRKVALTMEQVEQYDPPPNPAKMSDARAAAYVDKHGDQSWEVDALPPQVLSKLIRAAIKPLLDRDLMNEVIEREDEGKTNLRGVLKKGRAK